MEYRVVPFTPVMRASDGKAMGEGRGVGIHLGDVIRELRIFIDGEFKTSNENFAKGGFMYELWVESALSTYVGYDVPLIPVGEMEVDNIFMNLDKYDPEHEIVYEFKATWKSMRGLEVDGELDYEVFREKFWYFVLQVAAYCRAIGCFTARIVVWFINGDYSYREPNGGPQFRLYEFRFTQEELDQNWKTITQHAKQMRRSQR